MPERSTGGTYTLLVRFDRPASTTVGAAGDYDLRSGWYAYTGSALGRGGFARLDRHRAVARGENDTRHWHVDYLLGQPAASVAGAVRSPGVDAECAVARRIDGEPVPGFGASDCDCRSHLTFALDGTHLRRSVDRGHADARRRARVGPGGRR